MVNYEQALSIAKDLLGKADTYCEYKDYYVSVSYTHLTLPTNREV